MTQPLSIEKVEKESLRRKLNWLMVLRFIFASLLMGSTLAYQYTNRIQPEAMAPVLFLYGLAFAIVLLTIGYIALSPFLKSYRRYFAFGQICVDACCITLIIFITGSSSSVFSFLYLVVVIYASVFVSQRGTLFLAGLCSLMFAVLLMLEFSGSIMPFGDVVGPSGAPMNGLQVFQKCAVMVIACFSVAFLSGYLSDQERRSKAELVAMEEHLGRVQNLAQIGEMAAGLAHEIKNPLASLSGAIQILKGEMEASGDNMRLMQIVLRETDRLSNLVNNFLNFARPMAGQSKCISLGKAIGEIVILFEKDASIGERIRVAMEVVSDATIAIDPLQLRQVIWNLLLNAAESVENEGQITIIIQKVRNDWVRVDIKDDGCGMDEKTQRSIFNPFYTTKSNGTGLGLSIVYRILESYDCRLDVKSDPGAGSVFSIFFKTVEPGTTTCAT